MHAEGRFVAALLESVRLRERFARVAGRAVFGLQSVLFDAQGSAHIDDVLLRLVVPDDFVLFIRLLCVAGVAGCRHGACSEVGRARLGRIRTVFGVVLRVDREGLPFTRETRRIPGALIVALAAGGGRGGVAHMTHVVLSFGAQTGVVVNRVDEDVPGGMRNEELVDEVGVVLRNTLFTDDRGRNGFGVVAGDAAHHVRVGRGEDRGRGDVARANRTGRALVVAREVLLSGKRFGRLRLFAVAAAALQLGVVAPLVVVVAEAALLVVGHLGAKRMRPVDEARVVEVAVRRPGAVQHRARRFAGEKREVFPVAEGEARSDEAGVGLEVLRELKGFARDRAEAVGVAGRLRAGALPFGRRLVAAVADVAEVRLHVDRRAAAREEALGDAPVRVEDEVSQPLGFGGIPLREECLAVLPGHAEGDLRVGRALFVAHDARVRDFDAHEIAATLRFNALLFADVSDFDALGRMAALAVGVGVLVVIQN